MEVPAARVAPEQTVAKGELLTSPIPATGFLTTITILTVEVRGRAVYRARIAREANRGLGVNQALAEVISDASIRPAELSVEVRTVSREPIVWIMEAKGPSEAPKGTACSIRMKIQQTAKWPLARNIVGHTIRWNQEAAMRPSITAHMNGVALTV